MEKRAHRPVEAGVIVSGGMMLLIDLIPMQESHE